MTEPNQPDSANTEPTAPTDLTESPVLNERNEVAAVDLAAISAIFDEEGLEYRIEDNLVRTGFVNAAIVLVIDDSRLVFEAVWRGEAPLEMASHLLFACNEHNQTHFAPTLRFFEKGSDNLAVSAIRSMDITHGASFNQLGSFIVSSIDATMQAFDFLATSFPTLVTWEDTHNER
ncbi:YbjN domain-containing protein [Corynebacterium sp.]|uniref:YbjN domain-containing protein n=1 Tax=Corynebacterium sp. TaxID=1720 RepID=UPI002A917FCA|nr:YbjN domain-containing protein [Corynebacterium sp.]MDY5786157.1 YbjN domain-containing protein [Corynebacterium sp.]